MTAFTDSIAGMEIIGPELKEGDIITDVVIISRVMRMDESDSALIWHATEKTDSIVEMGMVNACRLLMESGYTEVTDDE